MNKSRRILVLDDDPDLGAMLKLMLEYKGYAVTLSERGKELEEILLNNAIDLVIMDMLLSGMNGVDVCARLKQDTSTAQMPVMMFSAHPNARELCVRAGADDFISKPFDMEDLLSKVNCLISKE